MILYRILVVLITPGDSTGMDSVHKLDCFVFFFNNGCSLSRFFGGDTKGMIEDETVTVMFIGILRGLRWGF